MEHIREINHDAYEWFDSMLAYVHSYEATKPKQHPALYSVFYPGGDNDKLFASDAEMIAPNASGGFDHDAPVLNGTKVVLIDTDHILWTETNGADWAWRVFTRGAGGFAIMDGGYSDYDDQGGGATYPDAENFRYNLGWILEYANRMNLSAMKPTSNTSLCSTGYCLRNAVSSGAEYLVYSPNGSSITVDLSAVSSLKTLTVEWFNPATGATISGGSTNGGTTRSFNAPFSGSAVLYIHDVVFSTTLRTIGGQDGWILEKNETSNKGGTLNKGSKKLKIGDNAANKQYLSILSFDTSALPDGAVITSVTLMLKLAGVAGTNPFQTHGVLLADICQGPFSGNPALQLTDFNSVCSKNNVLSYTNTKVDKWYSQSLNEGDFQYINLEGVTQFRLRFTNDDNHDFGADFLKIKSGNTGAANRPKLIIEYNMP